MSAVGVIVEMVPHRPNWIHAGSAPRSITHEEAVIPIEPPVRVPPVRRDTGPCHEHARRLSKEVTLRIKMMEGTMTRADRAPDPVVMEVVLSQSQIVHDTMQISRWSVGPIDGWLGRRELG